MTKSGKGNRMVRFILLLVCAVFVLMLVFLPKIARNYLNKNGKELTGRELNIEKIKINYFTSTVEVFNFKLYEQNESDVFISFDTLLINVRPLRLLKHEIHVEQLLLVNSMAHIEQHDSVFNFTDLIDFYTDNDNASGNESGKDESKEPYRLNLNGLELRSGGLSYYDLAIEHEMNVHDVSFIIPHIYWGEAEKSKADVTFKLARGGRFISSFDYDTESGDFDGVVDILNLEMETFLPYLQEYINFSDIDGMLSSKILFTGNEYNMEELSIKGIAHVDRVAIKDNQDKTVLGVESGKVMIRKFRPFHYYAEIDSVIFDQPYAFFALIDSTSNFEKMLVSHSAEANEQIETEEESEQIVVNNFIVNNGMIDFSDQRLYEEFNYVFSEVTVNMDTIALQDEWINIVANMKLNKRGNLDAKVGLNPMDPSSKVKIEYVISDFQLPDLNIYSKHYTGLPILFGNMYYVGNTSIENRQLESTNELIIRDVEMGRKTGGLYDIPLKLALFILKDINGDIVLDIPVSGDLSDPKTDIGAIVWDTFKGFVVKIVASPFKALGSLLGAEPKDLEEIPFNYGDTILLAKQERNLDLLVELEKMKPELQITLQYFNDVKLERTDIATVLMQKAFYKEHQKKAESHKKEYLNYLAEKSGKDSMLVQDYELLLAPSQTIDSVLQVRQELRRDLVKEYLTIKKDSSMIEVQGYKPEEVLNIGSRPSFRVYYTLAEDTELVD